jgi:DNA-binding response OmpR family regulator
VRGWSRVLVITAEPGLGASICSALQRHGLESVLAEGAADAVHRLADMSPTAVIVDLQFPEMRPEQLVHRALVCRQTHGSPVVLLAPQVTDAQRQAWIEQGCAAALRRDCDPRQVALAVRAVVHART